ncbi:MAG: ribosome assembly factor SBDS [Candidatus Hecatellales archaeon]|nr:MAG: ribosome assembly factor SBDS [Candidatus Hecatellales archaeon]
MSQKFTIARLVVSGERFEVMVNPDKALEYKLGKPVPPSQILVYDTIFRDVSKGERASEEKIRRAFGTTDPLKIVKTILDKGELQLTTEQRRRLIEDKKKQIIAFISKHCVDPRTNLPHPPLRVEQALAQAKVSIDPFKDVEEQAKEVIQALRPILPLKTELALIEVKIPPQYAPATYGTLKSFGSIKREQWLSDGSLLAVIEVPAGLQMTFLEKIGSLTKGTAQSKILK